MFIGTSGRIVGHPLTGSPSARFDANSVVHGGRNALSASQVALRRLDRDMAEKKLDLLQLATSSAAQTRAGSPHIMRREPRYPDCLGKFLDHMPNDLLADTISPDLSCRAYAPKELSGLDASSSYPGTQFSLDPIRDGNLPDVPTPSRDEIYDSPMALPLLKVIESQFGNLMPSSIRMRRSRASSARSRFRPLAAARPAPATATAPAQRSANYRNGHPTS